MRDREREAVRDVLTREKGSSAGNLSLSLSLSLSVRERERERVENGVMSYVIVTMYITRKTINIKSRGLLLSF